MDGVEEGRACCEGRRREDGGDGDYFSGLLIQEVKLAGARAGERQAGRKVGGGGEEEWEWLVQMDCLQRAAVPLACFTSPLSAALVFPLTGENRGEKGRRGLGSRRC